MDDGRLGRWPVKKGNWWMHRHADMSICVWREQPPCGQKVAPRD